MEKLLLPINGCWFIKYVVHPLLLILIESFIAALFVEIAIKSVTIELNRQRI